ncbi:glucose-6-phosphate dehydrogenase, partial [Candidatus Roizmanbacteria bacterium]|nr:glucose-6-phosphate dehydrogenase [Candidatus Roizmanbacteria bacterium]
IFGATGDLMTKKIAPALFNLYKKDKLPKMIRIVGVARRELSQEDFHKHIAKILREKLDVKGNSRDLKNFLKHFTYNSGKFEDKKTYTSLAKDLRRTDDEWKVSTNKLFYLAVPPEFYAMMFNHLHSSGLTESWSPEESWTRILVEKPFSKDAKDYERVDYLLGKLFKEEQIYRIDHYLAKEMLQNILSFRFSNNLFEQSWNNKFIEKIEIKLLEKIGVEKRGPFYDGLGALVDVGHNHLLQMLALITIDHPRNLSADVVRRKRSELLSTLKLPTEEEIIKETFRAQHEGYHNIEGVRKNSKTETYFKIKTFLDSPRWQGVPIYMESGKRMKNQIKEIVVTFKHVTPCLCPPGNHYTNRVTFSIEPQEAIRISFLAKKPGVESVVEVASRNFNFIYRKKTGRVQYVEEYEKLLLDCIEGNQLLFLSTKEVRSMWKYIDPIREVWAENKVPLEKYKTDTDEITKIAKKFVENKREVPIDILRHKEVGVVGLGKMGANIARQLIEKDWRVLGYNRTRQVTKQLETEGLNGAYSLDELVKKLKRPRVFWMMLPHGKPTDEVLKILLPLLDKGDVVVDAANAFYKETIKRSKKLHLEGVRFVDVGVSGGPMGARYGASLMVGGDKKTYEYLLPLFIDVAVPSGIQSFEGIGAGHFVKMVHNGIEYGMMQAIAEGFEVLKKSKYKVAEVYSHGTVIESRLVDWLREGLQIYGQDLQAITSKVPRGGEGDWTVDTAKELRVRTKIIEGAVKFRKESERNPRFAGKVLNTMRNMFGGHSITGELWDRNYAKSGRGGRT